MTDESTAPNPDHPDDLAFDPVPVGFRRNGWTHARQRQFIQALAKLGSVGAAARAVGMTARSAYVLRERPGAESFADAWDLAFDIGRGGLLDEAIRRGRDGYEQPVYRRGKLVGYRHVYDNRLLFAACYGRPMA